jgi:DNA-binding response OmpR family regulator
MDIQMPVMDGIAATKLIRKPTNINQNTPIIALTASTIKEKLDEATNAGMNAFLAKPFTPQQLIQKIQEQSFEKALSKTHRNSLSPISSNIDEVLLNQIYEDDPEYASEMIRTFEEDILPDFYRLEEVIQKGDFTQARQMVHKIKPSFSLIGLPFMQEEMSLLHELTKNEDRESVVLFHSLSQKMGQLLPEVRKVFATLSN